MSLLLLLFELEPDADEDDTILFICLVCSVIRSFTLRNSLMLISHSQRFIKDSIQFL